MLKALVNYSDANVLTLMCARRLDFPTDGNGCLDSQCCDGCRGRGGGVYIDDEMAQAKFDISYYSIEIVNDLISDSY